MQRYSYRTNAIGRGNKITFFCFLCVKNGKNVDVEFWKKKIIVKSRANWPAHKPNYEEPICSVWLFWFSFSQQTQNQKKNGELICTPKLTQTLKQQKNHKNKEKTIIKKKLTDVCISLLHHNSIVTVINWKTTVTTLIDLMLHIYRIYIISCCHFA